MKRLNFKYRLILSVTIVMTTIIIIASLLYRYTIIRNIKESEYINSKIILERITKQIDELYNQMDTATSSLIYNPQLKNTLNTLSNLDSSLSELELINKKNVIQNNLGTVLFFPNISNVFLYNKEKDYFYYSGYYLKDINYAKSSLYKNNYLNNKIPSNSKVILPPHISPWSHDSNIVLSLYKTFSDNVLTKDTIIEVQVPYKVLENICNQDSFIGNTELIIFDDNFNIVYPFTKGISLVDDKIVSSIIYNLKHGITEETMSKYSYIVQKSDYTNLNIMLLSNNSNINQKNTSSFIYCILFTALILLSTISIVIFIIKRLLMPLNELINYINTITIDNEEKLTIEDNGFDEFKIINQSFNKMLKKLKESMAIAYESQIKEIEANFMALQAQINPHFIYNTLNAISAASDIYGSEITQKMCKELSLMLRYTTSNSKDSKLIDEINHTKNYLELMKTSYVDSFDYDINIDPRVYDLVIPKLIIQPIVENCFKHGFNGCSPPWYIKINCFLSDKSYKIIISDNGIGFDKNALSNFKDFIETYKNNNYSDSYKNLSIGKLGLKNIYSRLSIFYNDNFLFNITYENGCKITLERLLIDD